MRIAGFSRTGRREPLPATIICLVLFVVPTASLIWKVFDGDVDALDVLLVIVGAWFGYHSLVWLWRAFIDNCSLEIGNGNLRVNMLFGRTLKLEDIRAVGWGEVVSKRSRSYLSLRLHLASGEPYDIPVVIFDEHPDEIARRIRVAAAS